MSDTYILDKIAEQQKIIDKLSAKLDKVLEILEENQDDIKQFKYDINDIHNKIIGY